MLMIAEVAVPVLLGLCAALHAFFVFGEMVVMKQNGCPLILAVALRKRGMTLGEPEPKRLVVTIVQNAGAYNVIMTIGFVLAVLLPYLSFLDFGKHGTSIFQGFFCGAAIWAGLFGLTLSKTTILQAVLGGAALIAVIIASGTVT